MPAHVLDVDQTGWSPLYRLYRTADGWKLLDELGHDGEEIEKLLQDTCIAPRTEEC